ncbi:hypothetical protein [Flavobacterium sp. WG21]|uniref:hypothetical protein n=1 Tax=Flavobacterium sp. WG21 TaxID=1229487 RepID=UPI00034BB5A4|nr:hypothetical protein [Flavobacterium sp. WG21]
MKQKINSIFKKIAEVAERNSDAFHENQPLIISSTVFNKMYCKESNVTRCAEQQHIFSDLKKFKKRPILYWFSIDDTISNAKHLREKYTAFRNSGQPRSTASYKTYFDANSKTLYVGKVKEGFHLRLVTHLGYSKNPNTAGMQLFHWYNPEVFGNLTLNYMVFNEEMGDLITILEMELARELKPIIGKY